MPGKLIGIARRGRPRAAMETTESALVSVERGIGGDYAGVRRGQSSGRRQVTMPPVEGWWAACRDLDAELPWTCRRANLLIEGLELAGQTGGHLEIGQLRLEITSETDPCERMEAQHPGLMAALAPDWRGGVTCRVLDAGCIELGDTVHFVPAET